MTTRIIICGGRQFNNDLELYRVLNKVLENHPNLRVIHGNATGVDQLAQQWAEQNNVLPTEIHPAEWTRYGKRAGPIRNEQMIQSGVDGVVAFPGGRGTQHLVHIAKEAGVPVWQPAEGVEP